MNLDLSERIEHLKSKLLVRGHTFSVIKEDKVQAFEQEHGIILPEEYRRFILEIADGGVGGFMSSVIPLGSKFGYIGDDESVDKHLARIKEEFPFKYPWLFQDNGEVPEEFELFKYTYPQKMRDLVFNGSMIISNDGCGEFWNLIITGPQRGKIWAFYIGFGIVPCVPSMDFLDFVEMKWDPIAGLKDILAQQLEILEAHKSNPKYREDQLEYDEIELLKLKIRSARESRKNCKLDKWL